MFVEKRKNIIKSLLLPTNKLKCYIINESNLECIFITLQILLYIY